MANETAAADAAASPARRERRRRRGKAGPEDVELRIENRKLRLAQRRLVDRIEGLRSGRAVSRGNTKAHEDLGAAVHRVVKQAANDSSGDVSDDAEVTQQLKDMYDILEDDEVQSAFAHALERRRQRLEDEAARRAAERAEAAAADAAQAAADSAALAQKPRPFLDCLVLALPDISRQERLCRLLSHRVPAAATPQDTAPATPPRKASSHKPASLPPSPVLTPCDEGAPAFPDAEEPAAPIDVVTTEAQRALQYCLLAQAAYSAPTGYGMYSTLEAQFKVTQGVVADNKGRWAAEAKKKAHEREVLPMPPVDVAAFSTAVLNNGLKSTQRLYDYLNVISTCLQVEYDVLGHSQLDFEQLGVIGSALKQTEPQYVAQALLEDAEPVLQEQHREAAKPVDLFRGGVCSTAVYVQPTEGERTARNVAGRKEVEVISEDFSGLQLLWSSHHAVRLKEGGGAPTRVRPVRDGLGHLLHAGEASLRKKLKAGAEFVEEYRDNHETDFTPRTSPGWVLTRRRPPANEPADEELCICIAGTQNRSDMYRDAKYVPVPMKVPTRGTADDDAVTPMLCHEGFYTGAEEVFSKIHPLVQAQVRKAASRRRKTVLRFCGHSLGGAVAMVLSVFYANLRMRHVSVGGVHTYGAPKVFHVAQGRGDVGVFSGYPVKQFVTNHDIIPRGLGSSVAENITKILGKLGIERVKFVSAESAPHLRHYKFIGQELFELMDVKKAKKAALPHTVEMERYTKRSEFESTLQFGYSYLRPRGVEAHRMASYLKRLQLRACLDAVEERAEEKGTYEPWAYPLALDEYPFGGKQKPLSEEEMIRQEVTFLADSDDSLPSDAKAHLATMLSGLESVDSGGQFPLVQKLNALARQDAKENGRRVSGPLADRPLLFKCEEVAKAVSAERRQLAVDRLNEFYMASQQKRARLSELNTEAQNNKYDMQLYDMKYGHPLSFLNVAFRLADEEIAGAVREDPKDEGAARKHWMPMTALNRVAKAVAPATTTRTLEHDPLPRLNKVFALLRERQADAGATALVEEHPNTMLLWAYCFNECRAATRVYLPQPAIRVFEDRRVQQSVRCIQTFARAMLSRALKCELKRVLKAAPVGVSWGAGLTSRRASPRLHNVRAVSCSTLSIATNAESIESLEMEVEEQAVRVLQRAVRCWLARQELNELFYCKQMEEEERRELAVELLQRTFRSYRSKCLAEFIRTQMIVLQTQEEMYERSTFRAAERAAYRIGKLAAARAVGPEGKTPQRLRWEELLAERVSLYRALNVERRLLLREEGEEWAFIHEFNQGNPFDVMQARRESTRDIYSRKYDVLSDDELEVHAIVTEERMARAALDAFVTECLHATLELLEESHLHCTITDAAYYTVVAGSLGARNLRERRDLKPTNTITLLMGHLEVEAQSWSLAEYAKGRRWCQEEEERERHAMRDLFNEAGLR
eukprot:TRINITY_DN16180_c0_g1_i2.p1 TRINITY_DN16180_c0_g1~~TRINITY_DN16180_c0_g1_i2.p1  ORF type:complete len:1438 (+),score=546.19 TRINITY_DN16180_c0_g1_i2:90-4403(+)